MILYPKELDKIFNVLMKNDICPIIVGGYIRDFLLKKSSKDIDVELYGINSYTKLEKLLEAFGSVNSVGKSFGVCKLQLQNIEIDFSFPRIDSKISSGHTGFDITLDERLKRSYVTDNRGKNSEINIIGKGKRNGSKIIIIGESKSQLSKNNVDAFIKRKLNRLSGIFNEEIFPLLITYMISSPDVEEYAKEKGITLYYSYDLLPANSVF